MSVKNKDYYKTSIPDGYICNTFTDNLSNKGFKILFTIISGLLLLSFLTLLFADMNKLIINCICSTVILAYFVKVEPFFHENIHRLAIKLTTGLNAELSVDDDYSDKHQKGQCSLNGYYLNKSVSIICLLAPFIFLNFAYITLYLIFGFDFKIISVVLCYTLASCSMDIYEAATLLIKYRGKDILVEFGTDNTSVYEKK